MGGELIGMAGRIIDKLRKQHGPAGRQRPPRPPQMQSGRMPMPDRLFARGGGVDRFERDRNLDKFLLY